MSLVFVGQGLLLPGPHAVELRLVLVQDAMGLREARRPAAPVEPGVHDAPAVLHPFARFTKDNLPDVPLWNPHIMTGRPFEGRRAVRDLLAVQRARLSAAVLHSAGLDRGAQAEGRLVRHVRARPAPSACGFAGAMLAAVSYGFCLWE
jgi:hypothetical protein